MVDQLLSQYKYIIILDFSEEEEGAAIMKIEISPHKQHESGGDKRGAVCRIVG